MSTYPDSFLSAIGQSNSATAVAEPPSNDAPETTPRTSDNEIQGLRSTQGFIEFELDGTIVNANEQFLSAMGYQLNEIQGQHHSIFVDPNLANSREYAEFWRRLGSGQVSTGEVERFDRDGNRIWIKASYVPIRNAQGRPVRVVKYLFDITALKAQQDDANRMRSMIDSMPTAVMYVDRDLVIQYANPASFELLRSVEHSLPIPADQIVGTCIDRFHKTPEHQRRLLSDPSNLPMTTQIVLGGETLSFSVSAIYNGDNEYIGAMASGRIMTEEVQTKAKAKEVGSTVATSVIEMGASIEEISRSVSRTASLAQDVEGIATLTETHVAELGESSRKIEEVVGVIQEFADQTNLLALNATIEAARAGESGRGFAVVASEVKELANATAKAAQSIDECVRLIRGSTTKVVESTRKITQGISEVSSNTTTVASAIEEQSVTMADLGQTANELKAITADG